MAACVRSLPVRVFAVALLAAAAARAEPIAPAEHTSAAQGQAIVTGDGVTAISLASGEVVWRTLQRHQTYAPTEVGDRIFVGSSDGLAAIDRGRGTVLWRAARGRTVFSPLAVGGLLYAGTLDAELIAFDATSGRRRWRRRLDGWIYSPVLSDGMLVTGGSAATLWWSDADSGTVRHRRRLDQELVAAPVAAAGGVVARTYAGTITYFDSQAEPRWQVTGPPGALPPLVAGSDVLVVGMDGRLELRSLGDGRPVWQGRLGSRILTPPVVAGDRVLLIADSGEAGLLDAGARRLRHTVRLPATSAGARPLFRDGQWLLIDADGPAPSVLSWPAAMPAGRTPTTNRKEIER